MHQNARYLAWLALIPLAIYPAVVSISPPSQATGKAVAMLPVLGLVAVWRGRQDWHRCWLTADRPALLAMLYLLASNLLTALWFHQADPAGTQAARIAMAMLLLPLVRLTPVSINAWWLGSIAGACGAAVLSLLDVCVGGESRAEGIYFHNIQGALGLLLGVVPLLASPAGWTRLWQRGLLWLGAVAGGISLLLSESRMAWLAMAALIAWRYARHSRQRQIVLCLIGAGALALLLLAPVSQRNTAWDDIVRYQHGEVASSLGMRFEMWRAAWLAIKAHPVFGIGPAEFQHYLVQGAAAGLWPAVLNQHTHAHNDLLHALTTTGVIGLIAQLLAFVLPWQSFRRHERAGNPAQQAAARGGMLVILSLFMLGLSETMFFHRFLFTWYYVSLMLMLGWSGQAAPASVTLAQTEKQASQP